MITMIEDDSQVGESLCGHCGAKFRPKRRWQLFCSSVCRFADWDERNPRQRVVTDRATGAVGTRRVGVRPVPVKGLGGEES
jgi:hypothetical protein